MNDRENDELIELGKKVERLIGSIQGNGGEGMAAQLKENREKVGTIEKLLEHVQTREGCAEVTKECGEKRTEEVKSALREALDARGRSKWLVIKDIILAVLSSSVIATIAAYLIAGRK